MPDESRPHILIVDDGETRQHEIGLDAIAATRSRHPADVDVADLEWANLVLMDFVISNWSDRDEMEQISLCPRNGLALAAVLREHADAANDGGHNYTAFAIHSAHIGEISARLHTSNKTPYVVARLNNLEWAFDKTDEARFASAVSLAEAVRYVSAAWRAVEGGGIETAITELLKLPSDASWTKRATDDVLLCQIPLSEFGGKSGLLFVRWLLHGIMPYPTFLLATHWVAARLRIAPSSLRQVMEGQSALSRDLAACRYSGVLASFAGPRWWRSAVDQYAWELQAAVAREPEAFHAELERRSGSTLQRVQETSPAVCVNRELNPLDGLCALDSVVRLVPDLWPAYADPAFAEVGVVRDDADLCAIVHPLDRERVLIKDEG